MSFQRKASSVTRRRMLAALVAGSALLFCGLLPRPSTASAINEVFVIGTLYKRHETMAIYDLAALRKVINAINPDVLVLDVNPTELKEQKVHPSKVEYPGVVFPLLNERKLRAYAGEPAEPMFTEIVQAVIKGRSELEKNNPEGLAAMKQFRTSTFEALAKLWKTPADVNSEATEHIIHGLKTYEAKTVGGVEAESQIRWDDHAVGVLLQAVKENPGKRILQVTGIENCPHIRTALRRNKTINLIDMEAWLRANVK